MTNHTNLDKLDLKILYLIEFNFNLSYSIISKKINRTKSFISFRIKRMEELGIIKNYKILIDPSKLGYNYNRIRLELDAAYDEKSIKDILKKHNIKIEWFVEKAGQDNFVITFLTKDQSELNQKLNLIKEELYTSIISYTVSQVFKIYHFPLNKIYTPIKLCSNKYFTTGNNNSINLNKLEQELLNILSKNPKVSKIELAKKLKISIQKLKSTIKYLEDNKVILAYQTIIDYNKLDYSHYKIFLNFNFSIKRKELIIEYLKQNNSVIYITESTYKYDLEFEILIKNSKELKLFLTELKNQKNFKIEQMKTSLFDNEEKEYSI